MRILLAILHLPCQSKKIPSMMMWEICQRFPHCNIKGLNVEPAEQNLEEFTVAQENLLNLSAIIRRDWTEVVKEDNNYIKVYPKPRFICCCLQGFMFQRACYDPKVEVNLLLLDGASGIYMQPLIPSMKFLQWQLGLNL
jgi:hypothetical protein